MHWNESFIFVLSYCFGCWMFFSFTFLLYLHLLLSYLFFFKFFIPSSSTLLEVNTCASFIFDDFFWCNIRKLFLFHPACCCKLAFVVVVVVVILLHLWFLFRSFCCVLFLSIVFFFSFLVILELQTLLFVDSMYRWKRSKKNIFTLFLPFDIFSFNVVIVAVAVYIVDVFFQLCALFTSCSFLLLCFSFNLNLL